MGSEFSPKEYLKKRHPERFSDSMPTGVSVLERAILEYHLESLTNRSEELLFEGFARGLIERTVCPNLLPHTGPTGGGDSKVDSETYPVAETLSLAWYVGNETSAATERWAFAFSAKKEWRGKVRDDIAEIINTKRGYSKAFFVSSRYIKDKQRADVEDELRKKHGIDVRIFDRTWILDKVFEGKLEQLAIDRLNIKTEVRHESKKGPRDTAFLEELNATEGKITAALQEGLLGHGLVEDCLTAADLMRSLERPRTEVDGCYARAERVAKQHGSKHQQIRVAYEFAWTTYWWYEDYAQFFELYTSFTLRVGDSTNVYELELWSNLLQCLYSAIREKRVATDPFDELLKPLLKQLDGVISEEGRPSASSQAHTIKLFLQLLVAKAHERPAILRELTGVVKSIDGLLGYPFEPLADIANELGQVMGELDGYQEFFEVVVDVASRREGEIVAAQMLARRGAQQLDVNDNYAAIRTLGRAMGRLFKHESREDAVRALYLASHAYERVGLLWAARGTVLAASSIATSETWSYDQLTPLQAACYSRMKWLELRLGRIGHLLAWHEVTTAATTALERRGHQVQRLIERDQFFDPILGMLLLRFELWELAKISRLPAVLQEQELHLAATALLYALGDEAQVPKELTDNDESPEARLALFSNWMQQPAATEIPIRPHLNISQTVVVESNIVGCHVVVNFDNESPCAELAESLIASLEAFLATGIPDRMMATEPEFQVGIRLSEFADDPFTFETRDFKGRPEVAIRTKAFTPHHLTLEAQMTLKNRLFEVVAHIMARAFHMNDMEKLLTKLFRDELAPQRALDFTTSFVVIGNVLGDNPKTNLSAWMADSKAEYRLQRTQPWNARVIADAVDGNHLDEKNGSESARASRDFNKVAHTHVRTVSLIRQSLWNQAKWGGVGFMSSDDPLDPPVLAIIFQDKQAGTAIFDGWREDLGKVDSSNRLRISILRGVRKDNPHWYRVIIGSAPPKSEEMAHGGFVGVLSRIHTMEPTSSVNLERFLSAFRSSGHFKLAQARLSGSAFDVNWASIMEKSDLTVREAWEVGLHELEVVGLHPEDDPIVPKACNRHCPTKL